MLHALDLLGTFAFALSGALLAARKRMDIFGVIVLAVAAGLGGGIVRDVLIGATPPVAITQWAYLATAAAAGLVGFAAPAAVARARRTVLVFDAAGLGLFAVAGTAKALDHGVPAVGAVVIGSSRRSAAASRETCSQATFRRSCTARSTRLPPPSRRSSSRPSPAPLPSSSPQRSSRRPSAWPHCATGGRPRDRASRASRRYARTET